MVCGSLKYTLSTAPQYFALALVICSSEGENMKQMGAHHFAYMVPSGASAVHQPLISQLDE